MTKDVRLKVYDKYSGHCAYCGKPIEYKDMQVDHMIPKRNGGTDDFENLMPACRMCNHYKRANSLETFRKMIREIPLKLERDSYICRIGMAYGNVVLKNRNIEFYFELFEVAE